MNRIRNLFGIALAALALAAPVVLEAQNTIEPINFSVAMGSSGGSVAFAGSGVTNGLQGYTSNCIWFATDGRAQGVPRFLRIRVGGDTTNDLSFLTSTNSQKITNAGTAGTNVLSCATTGFASNDLALIEFRFNSAKAYQLVNITNVGTGTLSISAGAKYATYPESSTNATADVVWKLSKAGFEVNGVATNTLVNSGQPFYIGREGVPTVLFLAYSNRADMNYVVGDYWRQPRP